MSVGTAGDDVESFAGESLGQDLSVGNDLAGVVLEGGLHSLEETHRLGRDNVHQRPALDTRKHNLVDGSSEFLLAQNHARAGPAQSLMSGGSHDVGMRYRTGMHPAGN